MAKQNPEDAFNSRLGTKDRLVAIYPIADNNKGLNAFGVESLVFHRSPSCFGLRVNNLLILNMSADYLFSARCGFPFPRTKQLLLDRGAVGMLENSGFTGRVCHPIMRTPLHKPSVLIYQPIMQISSETLQRDGLISKAPSINSFLVDHTLPPHPSDKGVLFRQHHDRVEVIRDMSQVIEFDSILGNDCKPMYQLIAQVYAFQNYILDLFEPVTANPELKLSTHQIVKLIKKHNTSIKNFLIRQSV